MNYSSIFMTSKAGRSETRLRYSYPIQYEVTIEA